MATALNNLAVLLLATNRYPEAEPLMRRALAIDEKSLGPDHPDVARDVNNLAELLRVGNRLAEAEPLYRRALAIDEKSFGPEHPNVATSNNLALLLQATNRPAEAEPLMRRASQSSRRAGPDHPNVALVAQSCPAADRHKPAGRGRAVDAPRIAIYEKASAPIIPMLPRLNNLAVLLSATNRLRGRAADASRAGDRREELGPDHPNVAIVNNLALLLQATNRLAEAESHYRRALAIDEKSFGPDIPTSPTASTTWLCCSPSATIGQLRRLWADAQSPS